MKAMRWVVFAVLTLSVLVGIYTLRHWIRGMVRIATMKDADPELGAAYAKKYVDDNIPGYHLPEVVRGKAALSASLIASPPGSITLDPSKGISVTGENLRFRREYVVTIWNGSQEAFSDVELRVQTPYPIDDSVVSPEAGAVDVRFEPDFRWMIAVSGTGSADVPKMTTSAWRFRAASLAPGGSAKITFVANSERDPRGRQIPPGEEQRFRMPEVGPLLTYIDGHFYVKVDDNARVKKSFYAPMTLTREREIKLGEPADPPRVLFEVQDAFSPLSAPAKLSLGATK